MVLTVWSKKEPYRS